MDNKLENAVLYRDYIVVMLWLYRENGKEHGNYHII